MPDPDTSGLRPVIGFIGLGQMGGAMARRMLAGGASMLVHDTAPARAAEFARLGATLCNDPLTIADQAEIVFASLPNAPTSLAVAGRVAAGRSLRHYVELSTIGRQTMEQIETQLAQADIGLVDCPVSGGPKAAEQGSLAIIAAGPASSIDAVRPFLDLVSPRFFAVGDRPGQAQVMKLVNNLISAANMASAFEALVVGAKAGLDPDTMVAVVNAGTGRNTATETKVPQAVLTGSFDYGARLAIMAKDIALGMEEAAAAGVPTWTLEAVSRLFRHAVGEGRGDDDYTTLIKSIEKRAGVEVRSRKDGT